MENSGLYHLLIELTGLDRDIVEAELKSMMDRLGLSADNLTTADIRRLVTLYLEEMNERYQATEDTAIDKATLPELILKEEAEA